MRILSVVFLAFVVAGLPTAPPDRRVFQANAAERPCGGSAKAFIRTTLYFGLSRMEGSIGDDEWKTFLRDEVTPRFPSGLTVWEADGQWRRPDRTIAHEKAKVVLLVHDGGGQSQRSIMEIIARYKDRFQQESVLWESAGVCAMF